MKTRTPRGKELSEKEITRRQLQARKYEFTKKVPSIPVRGIGFIFFLVVILPLLSLLALSIYLSFYQ